MPCRRFVLLVVFALLWGIGASAPPANAQPRTDTEATSIESLRQLSGGFKALAGRVHPSVVHVMTQRYTTPDRGAPSGVARRKGSGSGVFVDPSGYIVTNAHVVAGAYQTYVRLAPAPQAAPGEKSILRPQGEIKEATVVGIDRETDVAVLKVAGEGHPVLPWGDSDTLRSGQIVFAFGSPLGLEASASMGIVSATARQLEPEDPMIYVQTDAPINPGSSGGPLVSTDGKMVGINTLILSRSGGSDGLGFAAPSNIVKAVYEQIRTHGRVRRGVIGVHAQTLTPELREAMDAPSGYRVILADVFPNSPAARAGLRPGDIIAQLNGKTMENGRQFDVNLYGALGTLAGLTVVRGDSTFQVSVRVVERSRGRQSWVDRATPSQHRIRALGILGLPVTDALRTRISGLRGRGGVVVASTTAMPTPWGDRLRPGDVIHTLNGAPVESPAEVRALLEDVAGGTQVVAHVLRDGRRHLVVLLTQGRPGS